MSASVNDIGDVKSFELLETIGSGAFGVVMVVGFEYIYCLYYIESPFKGNTPCQLWLLLA